MREAVRPAILAFLCPEIPSWYCGFSCRNHSRADCSQLCSSTAVVPGGQADRAWEPDKTALPLRSHRKLSFATSTTFHFHLLFCHVFSLPHSCLQWNPTWGSRKHLISTKSKHRNRLNLEPALILALTKIRPPIEVLAARNKLRHLINRSEPH
jgi:hypothetical protein